MSNREFRRNFVDVPFRISLSDIPMMLDLIREADNYRLIRDLIRVLQSGSNGTEWRPL